MHPLQHSLKAEDIMWAWKTSVEPAELRRKFDDDEDDDDLDDDLDDDDEDDLDEDDLEELEDLDEDEELR